MRQEGEADAARPVVAGLGEPIDRLRRELAGQAVERRIAAAQRRGRHQQFRADLAGGVRIGQHFVERRCEDPGPTPPRRSICALNSRCRRQVRRRRIVCARSASAGPSVAAESPSMEPSASWPAARASRARVGADSAARRRALDVLEEQGQRRQPQSHAGGADRGRQRVQIGGQRLGNGALERGVVDTAGARVDRPRR
jgi:hypothetical protein